MRPVTYIILIVVIILVGVTDVCRQLVHLSYTKKSVQNAKRIIQKKQSIHSEDKNQSSVMRVMSREKMTDLFLTWVESSGLSLSSFLVTEKEGDLDMNAVFIGNFQQMTVFFKAISEQCFPFLVRNAVIYKEQNELKLKLASSLSTTCLSVKKTRDFVSDSKKEENPFDHFFEKDGENRLQMFSVRQIKFSGFLKYDDHLAAIVREPTGRSIEILMGDVLGPEKAKVIHIDETGVLLQLNGKNFLIKNE